MLEGEEYSILSEDLKMLKEFFGQIPSTGNQIVILVVGSHGAERELFKAMKAEIRELKDALHREINGGVTSTRVETPPSNKPADRQKGPSHTREEIVEAMRKPGGDKKKAAELPCWKTAPA